MPDSWVETSQALEEKSIHSPSVYGVLSTCQALTVPGARNTVENCTEKISALTEFTF